MKLCNGAPTLLWQGTNMDLHRIVLRPPSFQLLRIKGRRRASASFARRNSLDGQQQAVISVWPHSPGLASSRFGRRDKRRFQTSYQPMVIKLAFPPAAAVLRLSERSMTKRSSPTLSYAPRLIDVTLTIGPGRRASVTDTSSSSAASPV